MGTAFVGKTFSIDLKSFYEHILDRHTYFGYWIEHEESDDVSDGYYDLKDLYALYVCDGETCSVVDVGKDCVGVISVDNPTHVFILTKEEFGFVCNE